jgi:uncharacterized protein involved in outer membrane biogenesis
MRVPKPIRWILYILGGFITGLLLIILLLAIVRIPIDLTDHKQVVESAGSLALGRSVKVDDKIVITTSLQPIFSLEGLRISNPKNFGKGDFLRMKTAEFEIRVLPLLLGKVKIAKFSVKGLAVMLRENKSGAVNWSSQESKKTKTEPSPPPQPAGKEPELELTSDSLVLTKLDLEDISVDYRRPGLPEPLLFKIDKCTGTMLPGQPFILAMTGKLLSEPYATEIEISSLQELVEESRTRMEINTEIAKTRFDFGGSVDLASALRSLQLNAAVSGEHLNSLNGLLDLDLPPLKAYKAAGELSLQRDRLELTNLILQVGKSKLTGKMTADRSRGKPDVAVELISPLIQLNDFDVGDWSPEKRDADQPDNIAKKDEKPTSAESGNKDAVPEDSVEELLSPEVLARFNVRLNVEAEKVISGADQLGSGVLTATLKDGRFALDPVQLNVPGGSFNMAATLIPDPRAPEASVRMEMKKFDFGILVRRTKPRADMGGTINLDVDLKSSADSFEKLMASSNGYFDFSGRLENLKAGIIDLWAVNVIAAIATGKDNKPSEINCVLGRWTMKEGMLKPEIFLIDTTKIRICGKGQVDFKKETIDLKMAPRPKKPEFFSLATPIEVKGNFADFGVGIQAGGLFGTSIRFITSPVVVPLKRLFTRDLPTDGEDVCSLPIGPQNRSVKKPAGCR